jgi:hypothetical protein
VDKSLAEVANMALEGNLTKRHAAMMLAYDNVQEQHNLTIQSLESLLAQDIGPMDILLIDNGSTLIGTWEHFQMVRDLYMDREDETRIHCIRNEENLSPVKLSNRALQYFWKIGHDKVLGAPNDVILPPNFYRLANEWPRGIVCATMTDNPNFPRVETAHAVSECTPLAVGIIRKWLYDALVAKDGYFLDENFFLYASDCDFALRIASCGIRGVQLDMQYWHYGSAHWRLLSQEEGRKQTNKADADRQVFIKKWGFPVTDYEYGRLASDINFQGKARAVTV